MAYESEHASALADVRAAGVGVSFVREAPGEYDAETDTWDDAGCSAVDGYAIQVAGDAREYERLGLVEMEAPTLMFVAGTFGEAPGLGSVVEWAARMQTVRSVRPFAPAGVPIFSHVVIA